MMRIVQILLTFCVFGLVIAASVHFNAADHWVAALAALIVSYAAGKSMKTFMVEMAYRSFRQTYGKDWQ